MTPLHHDTARQPLEEDANCFGNFLPKEHQDDQVKQNDQDVEQAYVVVDLYELDDAPATPVAGHPEVPPLVDREWSPQDEGEDEDGRKRVLVLPEMEHGMVIGCPGFFLLLHLRGIH